MKRPPKYTHRGSRKRYDFYLCDEADALFEELETQVRELRIGIDNEARAKPGTSLGSAVSAAAPEGR